MLQNLETHGYIATSNYSAVFFFFFLAFGNNLQRTPSNIHGKKNNMKLMFGAKF